MLDLIRVLLGSGRHPPSLRSPAVLICRSTPPASVPRREGEGRLRRPLGQRVAAWMERSRMTRHAIARRPGEVRSRVVGNLRRPPKTCHSSSESWENGDSDTLSTRLTFPSPGHLLDRFTLAGSGPAWLTLRSRKTRLS